jgi:hypothetical protein
MNTLSSIKSGIMNKKVPTALVVPTDYVFKLYFGTSTSKQTGDYDDTGNTLLSYIYTQGRINVNDATRGWVFNGLSMEISNFTTSPTFTRCVWVNSTSGSDGTGNVINSPSVKMNFGTSTTAGTFAASINSTTVSDPFGVRSQNVWYHMAITYNGTTLILYVNGSAVASAVVTTQYTGSTNTLNLFNNASSGGYFGGLGDNFLMYSRALTSTEINNIYTYQLNNPTL